MIESPLALFLQAAGGFHPPESLEDRMRAFEVVMRVKYRTQPTCTIGGTRSGDVHLIGRRDFALNLGQRRMCVQRAKDFIARYAGALSSDRLSVIKLREAA